LSAHAAATGTADAAPHAWATRARKPASHATTHSAAASAHGCDSVPSLRLLIGRKNGDRITTIRERLLAHAIHLRTHLFHPLTHPCSRR
jgi:hypothetical protein